MSGVRIVVLRCSGLTSLQDRGRRGYQRYGLSASGPMDPLAMAAANALAGNATDAAVVEFGLGGGAFRAEGGEVRLGLAGALGAVRLDGAPVIGTRSFTLPAGAELEVGPPREGAFGYLAVAGGVPGESILGSRALHMRARIGGVQGRLLQAGDAFAIAAGQSGGDHALDSVPLYRNAPIRVMLGPQENHFSDEGRAILLGETFTVTHHADRMGYRLDGPRIAHGPGGGNIVSDGTAPGAIQVPGNGQPIVLMADRQTTGGYPKIATVISADLRRLAQRRPGDSVRFIEVDLAAAVAAARSLAATIRGLASSLRDVATADAERLAGANLAGDVVDAFADPP